MEIISLLLTKEVLGILGGLAVILALYFKGRSDGKASVERRVQRQRDILDTEVRKAEAANQDTERNRREKIDALRNPDISDDELIELWDRSEWGSPDDS